ncbi:hypothetical protein [Pedobacter sp.]|uniref:hypothetical protein n=1 Tax=Pedobacter sp. TaxID=1411316 RepID=UPI003D7FEA8F
MNEDHYIQPIQQSDQGLANSFTGRLIDYINPTPAMISLQDISTGLTNICRFGGQIKDFYSVAEHTMLVWHLCPDHLKQAALLHDAAEAYLGDVIKPLKMLIQDCYGPIEEKFEKVIFQKFGVDLNLLTEVKHYDIQALEIENNYFRFGNLDFISKFYDINEELYFGKTIKEKFYMLLRSEFSHREIGG